MTRGGRFNRGAQGTSVRLARAGRAYSGQVSETNWAGNVAYRTSRIHYPETVEDVQRLVAASEHVRALGSRHAFSDISDTSGELISLDRIDPDIRVAPDRRSVEVGAGATYAVLADALHAEGLALHNLASLPHLAVGGAVATGTHGSGDRYGTLASAVAAIEIVTADGEVRRLERGDHDFEGSVVSLGALGIATRVTLDVEPTYDVAQEVHTDLPWQAALEHFDEIFASADSVSMFTTWQPDVVDQVWRKTRLAPDNAYAPRGELFGAPSSDRKLHPIAHVDPANCTDQLGVPGPWHDRLPHFKASHLPSAGNELQSEYLVPRENAVAALEILSALAPQFAELVQVSEIRTIAADSHWLSGAYGRQTVGLHFTWFPRSIQVRAVNVAIEEALAPLDARPHWGKVFVDQGRRAAQRYPRIDDFRALRERWDPTGKFRNTFVDRHLMR